MKQPPLLSPPLPPPPPLNEIDSSAVVILITAFGGVDMVAKNEFRQDLLYRMNTVEINLPPLYERQEDIPPLADHFLRISSKKYKKKYHGRQYAGLKEITSLPLAGKHTGAQAYPGTGSDSG